MYPRPATMTDTVELIAGAWVETGALTRGSLNHRNIPRAGCGILSKHEEEGLTAGTCLCFHATDKPHAEMAKGKSLAPSMQGDPQDLLERH